MHAKGGQVDVGLVMVLGALLDNLWRRLAEVKREGCLPLFDAGVAFSSRMAPSAIGDVPSRSSDIFVIEAVI